MFPLWELVAQSEPSGFVVWIDRIARAPLSKVVLVAAALTFLRLAVWPILKSTQPDDRFGLYNLARVVNEVCDAVVYAGVVVFMLVRPFGVQTFYIPSGSMIDTLMLNDYIVANKFVYRFWKPKHGDIVVFKPPARALNAGQEDTDFIKRLIGEPGDVIEFKDRVLYRNGAAVPEPYVDFTYPGNHEGPVVSMKDRIFIRQADFKLVEIDGKVVPLQYTDTFVNTMPLASTTEDGSLTQCAPEYVPPSPDTAKEWRDLPAVKVPADHYLFMGDNRNGSSDGRSWGLATADNVIGKSEFIWFPISRWQWTK